MANTFKFELGDTLRDMVTGYSGIVTGRGDHISGCNTYGLQKKADEKGDVADSKWFDETRLEAVPGAVRVMVPIVAAPPTAAVRRRAGPNPKPTRAVGK